jgi:hypothetical protein
MNITYQITTDLGMQTVEGEVSSFGEMFGAKFGTHKNPNQFDGDLRCWSVTHIESGFAIAYGPTKASAEFAAKERLNAKGEESFRKRAEKVVKRRAEIERSDFAFTALED